jgi:hypothetical protein
VATNIVINNLDDGASVDFMGTAPNKSYTVTGRATAIPPDTVVSLMGYCIDGFMVRTFMPNMLGNYDPFEFVIPETDCPNTNQWYMLAVHAFGDFGDHTVETRSFKRVS